MIQPSYRTDLALDRDQLLSRLMGNAALADRMLDQFVATSPAECDLMETAARMGDARMLASTAHRHKGTAATMAAERVAALASELERAATECHTDRWLALIDQLRLLHSEIRQLVGTPSSGPCSLPVRGEMR